MIFFIFYSSFFSIRWIQSPKMDTKYDNKLVKIIIQMRRRYPQVTNTKIFINMSFDDFRNPENTWSVNERLDILPTLIMNNDRLLGSIMLHNYSKTFNIQTNKHILNDIKKKVINMNIDMHILPFDINQDIYMIIFVKHNQFSDDFIHSFVSNKIDTNGYNVVNGYTYEQSHVELFKKKKYNNK